MNAPTPNRSSGSSERNGRHKGLFSLQSSFPDRTNLHTQPVISEAPRDELPSPPPAMTTMLNPRLALFVEGIFWFGVVFLFGLVAAFLTGVF